MGQSHMGSRLCLHKMILWPCKTKKKKSNFGLVLLGRNKQKQQITLAQFPLPLGCWINYLDLGHAVCHYSPQFSPKPIKCKYLRRFHPLIKYLNVTMATCTNILLPKISLHIKRRDRIFKFVTEKKPFR